MSAVLSASPCRSDSQITIGVRSYCHRQGYDASTTQSAIAWALRSPGATTLAAAAGRERADQLHQRLLANQPKEPA